MDRENKHSFQRSRASSVRSASRPIRTTASYMHAPKTEPVEENSRRSKKAGRRRSRSENTQKKNFPWKSVCIGAGVVVVIAVILLFILGSDPKMYHQMPKVTPPETVENMEVGA